MWNNSQKATRAVTGTGSLGLCLPVHQPPGWGMYWATMPMGHGKVNKQATVGATGMGPSMSLVWQNGEAHREGMAAVAQHYRILARTTASHTHTTDTYIITVRGLAHNTHSKNLSPVRSPTSQATMGRLKATAANTGIGTPGAGSQLASTEHHMGMLANAWQKVTRRLITMPMLTSSTEKGEVVINTIHNVVSSNNGLFWGRVCCFPRSFMLSLPSSTVCHYHCHSLSSQHTEEPGSAGQVTCYCTLFPHCHRQ